MADTTKSVIMYALIENQRVIGVFDSHISAVENGETLENIIPINKLVLFYLDGGAIIVGELMKYGEDWQVIADDCSYPLHDVDFWQPIGTWLSF